MLEINQIAGLVLGAALAGAAFGQVAETERITFDPDLNGTIVAEFFAADGRTLVIRHNSVASDPALRIWTLDSGDWEIEQLVRGDGGIQQGPFGDRAVILHGDRLILASQAADGLQGRVYVTRRENGKFRAFLKPEELLSTPFPAFSGWARSVSASERWIAVGAFAVPTGNRPNVGRVCIYEDLGGEVVLRTILAPPPSENTKEDLSFGVSVAISETHLAVGVRPNGFDEIGKVLMYERDRPSGRWLYRQTIRDPLGVPRTDFGYDIEIREELLAIGQPRIGDNPIAHGRVQVFELDSAGHWGLKQTLRASNEAADGGGGNHFGRHLDIEGDVIAVAVKRAVGLAGVVGTGAVYLYKRKADGQWPELETQILAASDTHVPSVGNNVAIANGVVFATTNLAPLPEGDQHIYLWTPGFAEEVCPGDVSTIGTEPHLSILSTDLSEPDFVLHGCEAGTGYVLVAALRAAPMASGLCLGGSLLRVAAGEVAPTAKPVWGEGSIPRLHAEASGAGIDSLCFQAWTRSPTGEVAYSNAVRLEQ